MLAVAASARASAASPKAFVTLSHELPTAPLPAPPVVVGDPWQNRGLRLLAPHGDGIAHLHSAVSRCSSYRRDLMSHRRLVRVAEQLDRSDPRRRLRALLAGASPPRPESVVGLLGGWPP